MSKGERWTIIISIIGLVGIGLQVWLALLHEEEHRAGIMTTVGMILLAVVVALVNLYAIYRNLKDASRVKGFEARIIALKNEHQRLVAGLEKQHEHQEYNSRQSTKEALAEVRALKEQLATKDSDCAEREKASNQRMWDAYNKESAEWSRYKELFAPVQIEAFQLARELRGFLRELGPRPDVDWQSPNDSDQTGQPRSSRNEIASCSLGFQNLCIDMRQSTHPK